MFKSDKRPHMGFKCENSIQDRIVRIIQHLVRIFYKRVFYSVISHRFPCKIICLSFNTIVIKHIAFFGISIIKEFYRSLRIFTGCCNRIAELGSYLVICKAVINPLSLFQHRISAGHDRRHPIHPGTYRIGAMDYHA